MYNYEEQKPRLFTDEGQRLFLAMRDRAKALLKEAGAFRMMEVMRGHEGDTWDQLACIDRLVELEEIRELTNKDVAGQHRVFISTR